jgi:hypothetical protein
MRLRDLIFSLKFDSKLSVHSYKNKELSTLLCMFDSCIKGISFYMISRLCMGDICFNIRPPFIVVGDLFLANWCFTNYLPIVSIHEPLLDIVEDFNFLPPSEISVFFGCSFNNSVLSRSKNFINWVINYLYAIVSSFFFYKFVDGNGGLRRVNVFKRRRVLTLLKSPNGNKKARAQFSKLLYSFNYQLSSYTAAFFYNYSVFADFLPSVEGIFLEICRSLYRDSNA